jgi:hypothetical protein
MRKVMRQQEGVQNSRNTQSSARQIIGNLEVLDLKIALKMLPLTL